MGFRLLTRHWLEEAGAEVVGEAVTWTAATEMASALQPDVVVADLWMPTFDVGALVRLREMLPTAAIVSLSTLSVDEARELVGDQGSIDLFLSKRDAPETNIERIRTFLRARLPDRAL